VALGSLALIAAANALQTWAMVVNPFFSPEIHLQPGADSALSPVDPIAFCDIRDISQSCSPCPRVRWPSVPVGPWSKPLHFDS
jgi:hypothetical protein